MKLTRSLEQLTAGRVRWRLTCEHGRHLFAGKGQLRQSPERLRRIAQALDTVIMGVALDELSLDVLEGVLVFENGEEDGRRHLACFDPSGLHAIEPARLGRLGHLRDPIEP
jgi:hypothetical protein